MYDERRESFSIKDVILQILLIILFVLILIFIFPTKGHIKKLFGGNNVAEQEKIEASADDIDRMAVIYNQIFANNIYKMKEAAKDYYTNDRLPQTVGDYERITLQEMYDKHLVLKLTDKEGNYCDAEKSYVSVTKYENEYQMKVNLSCGDDEDFIIVYLGCYDYCDASGVCEKQVTVTPTSNPSEKVKSNTPSEPESNEPESNEPASNTPSEPESNEPTSNTPSNPESNEPTSNPSTDDKCDMKIKKNMTLFFETSGGTRITSISFCTSNNCDEESITLPTPEREGYKFDGWYTDSSYENKVSITSNKSEDISKLDIYNIISVLDTDGCGRTDDSFAFVYAKWVKDGDTPDEPENPENDNKCKYVITTEGSFGEFGEWSEWSKNPVKATENMEVETEVRQEVVGSHNETRIVGTKLESVVVGQEEKEVPTGKYKYEKYVSRQETVDVLDHYETEEYVSGYEYEKYVAYTIKKEVKTPRVVETGEYVTKVSYEKVPTEDYVYQSSGSGTQIPESTSEYQYRKTGSTTSQSCSGCAVKTIYTWDVYKKMTVYTVKEVKEQVPVYKTVYDITYEEVPVYDVRKVEKKSTRQKPVYRQEVRDVYDVKKIPETKIVKVDVYDVREVPVEEVIKVDDIDDVTYYRYRVKTYIGGATAAEWSTCDPVDQELIDKGYILIGKGQEA